MYRVAKLLSLMSTGFLAGVFTYAFFAIIPAWNEVPRAVHFTYRVALMRHNGGWHPGPAVVGLDHPRHAGRAHLRRGCRHHECDRGAGHSLRKCAHQPAD
jgi:hypothetical protein